MLGNSLPNKLNSKMMIYKAYLDKKPGKKRSLNDEINKRMNKSSTFTINSFVNSP